MNKHKLTRFALIVGSVLLTVMTVGWVSGRSRAAKTSNGVINLIAPTFARTAFAEGASVPLNLPDDEMGITGYFNAGQTIALNDVVGLYRTVEAQTADYILGSVSVPSYDENNDVHVFIHTNGWVAIYYHFTIPTSKIFDSVVFTGGNTIPTRFDSVSNKIADALSITPPILNYYHFQHPDANRLLLVADGFANGADNLFNLNIPSTFTYFERSWATRGFGMSLDGNRITNVGGTKEGFLSESQLSPDQLHQIYLFDGGASLNNPNGAIALVYMQP